MRCHPSSHGSKSIQRLTSCDKCNSTISLSSLHSTPQTFNLTHHPDIRHFTHWCALSLLHYFCYSFAYVSTQSKRSPGNNPTQPLRLHLHQHQQTQTLPCQLASAEHFNHTLCHLSRHGFHPATLTNHLCEQASTLHV